MRVVWVLAVSLSLLVGPSCNRGAGPGEGRPSPPTLPPPPKTPVVVLNQPRAPAAALPRALDKIPDRATVFVQLARNGEIVPDVTTNAVVTSIAGERVDLAAEQGAPLQLLLRLPADLQPRLAKDQRVRVSFRQTAEAPGISERITIEDAREGAAPLLERANLHGEKPIALTLAKGALQLRQGTAPLPGAETAGAVTKASLPVEVRASGAVQTAVPGRPIEVKVSGHVVRLLVVGSARVTTKEGAPTEWNQYHLHVVAVGLK
ncbi:MAG TPA: hypothetical protein VKQ32_21490 [Polyangia bacterium]|nr:hypothetical protein [Polyangia bacterium]